MAYVPGVPVATGIATKTSHANLNTSNLADHETRIGTNETNITSNDVDIAALQASIVSAGMVESDIKILGYGLISSSAYIGAYSMGSTPAVHIKIDSWITALAQSEKCWSHGASWVIRLSDMANRGSYGGNYHSYTRDTWAYQPNFIASRSYYDNNIRCYVSAGAISFYTEYVNLAMSGNITITKLKG